ncbi:MAG: AI-2E family transporter [Thiohalocapsa sp.]
MDHEGKTDDEVSIERAVEAAIRIGLIAVMLALCYSIVRPFLIPIAWGIIIAVAAWPGYCHLLSVFSGRRSIASVVFVLIWLVVLIVPGLLLSGTLVEGAQGFAKGFAADVSAIPPAPDLHWIPLVGGQIQDLWNHASSNMEGLLRSLEPQIKMIGKWLLSAGAHAGVALLHFVIAIVIAAALLAKSESAGRVAHAIARRLAGHRGDQFADLAEAVVRSVSRGILGVALIQSVLAGLGMLAAGVPAAGLWALVTLLLATIQIGAIPVLLPAVIYVFYHASLPIAVLFLIWSLFVSSIDNILKPLLLGRGVSVPMLVIFIGAIGGFIAHGIIGLFVGSVVLVLGYELVRAWLGDPRLAEEVAASPNRPDPPDA